MDRCVFDLEWEIATVEGMTLEAMRYWYNRAVKHSKKRQSI